MTGVLDRLAAAQVIQAARRDYEALLAAYGEHEELVVGDPVHCFDGTAE